MKYRAHLKSLLVLVSALCGQTESRSAPENDAVTRETAHDIFKQLIEIDTTDSVGSTTVAAQTMAKRLLDAGFPKADVVVIGPNDRKGNMVARYRGKSGSKSRPVLIIGHRDVVEARREDWSTDHNAIYHVADALGILEKSPFPFELNPVTREYFGQMAKIETGQTAADLHAIPAKLPDSEAFNDFRRMRAITPRCARRAWLPC